MSIQAGLVGLPNVGKSTLFNALTKSSIPAENYPFCTIDPHVAITHVPDERSEKLKKIYNSQTILPATVTFVDIAGLVKGAAAGEGLGNQFLSHIREVNLILHVLRCFEDPNIIHTSETIDPISDYETIVAELMLKDLESLAKRLERLPKLIKTADPKSKKELESESTLLHNLKAALEHGDQKRIQTLLHESEVVTIPLLSGKNFIIIANMAEHELEHYKNNKFYQQLCTRFGTKKVIPICARTEYELSQLEESQAREMMDLLGIKESGLSTIIRGTYDQLGLITFFTCGPKEIHAWPITQGMTVRKAAGEIHSDLERGFICAELFNCADLFALGSEAKVRDAGKMRREGQDYIVQDGDIINIKFNV